VQSAAVVEVSGIASGQRVVLSITVNRYENPEERGSGPTRSTVHGDVKNGEPGPGCGQPGVRHGNELSFSDSADSFEPKRKRKHPFLANRNWNKQDAWKLLHLDDEFCAVTKRRRT
jgi:hypothetical protein